MTLQQPTRRTPSPALAVSAVLFVVVAIAAAMVLDQDWFVLPLTLGLIVSIGTMNAALAGRWSGPLRDLQD